MMQENEMGTKEIVAKVFAVPQRSEEWNELRRGILTASRLGKLVTGTGRRSASETALLHELVAERAGAPAADFTTEWMERGAELEAEALHWYELVHGVELERVGFVYRPDLGLGCSPDAMHYGWHYGVEVKVLKPANHVHILMAREIPADYLPQVFGNMIVTGAVAWDVVFYSDVPKLPPRVFPVSMTGLLREGIEGMVREFTSRVDEVCERLGIEWRAAVEEAEGIERKIGAEAVA